jgi:hypothetical protein
MSDEPHTVIEGKSGSSGLGYSELKDIECEWRFAHINSYKVKGIPVPTNEDEQEAFRCGSYLHAGRAKWLVLNQKTDKEIITKCQQAAREDILAQGYSLPELTQLEYELMFLNYANYWAIRVMPKAYAVELFLEHDFGSYDRDTMRQQTEYIRTTRLDDLSYYPDVGGHCIGEFKTTYDLSGALKFYNANNPQILLQQLIYVKNSVRTLDMIEQHKQPGFPLIKGTMVDLWDKGRNRGARQFLPLNESVLKKFEVFIKETLRRRKGVVEGTLKPQRNYFVCNTFNDAYKSQCKFKERCAADE